MTKDLSIAALLSLCLLLGAAGASAQESLAEAIVGQRNVATLRDIPCFSVYRVVGDVAFVGTEIAGRPPAALGPQ
jgi:hypothetical protein